MGEVRHAELALTSHSDYKTSPKWSFTSAPNPKDRGGEKPGPGKYPALDVEKNKFKRTPAYSITGLHESKDMPGPPGPDRYKPDRRDLKSYPRWGFGSEPRLHEAKRAKTPGPGSYETRKDLGGSQRSMSGLPIGRSKSCTPGPGAYKPSMDPVWNSAPKSSFGSASNSDLVLSKTPGPGKYHSESLSTLGGNIAVRSAAAYSVAGKRPTPKVDITPGPSSRTTMFGK